MPSHDHAMPHPGDHVAASFDERAASWDDDAKVARAAVIAERIARRVPLHRGMSLFEYGAGTALVSQALASSVGAITLADPSSGMRDQINAKIADGRLRDARVWDLDLSTSNAPEGEAFDLIVTSMVLHHVDPLEPTLQRLADLLVPTGRLCVVDLDAEDGSFHDHGVEVHHGFDRAEFASLLTAIRLVDVTLDDCGTVDRDGREYGLFLAVGTR